MDCANAPNQPVRELVQSACARVFCSVKTRSGAEYAPVAEQIILIQVSTSERPSAPTPRLTRISHQLSAAARDKAVSTSLRLLTMLDILFKYACAR
jgi:hypothetical protein